MALRRQEDVKALDLSRRAIDIPNQGSKSRQCSFSDRLLGVLEKAVGMPYTLCRHKHDGRMTVHIPSFSRSLLRLALCARRVQTGRHL